MSTDAGLALIGVGKRFGAVDAVRDCDLAVAHGEIVALLGPSGCGKSTLLNIIAGFEAPDRGELRLGGRPLAPVPPHRRNIGMVFQHYAMFPHLTVAENVAYGLEARRLSRDAVRSRVGEMLALLKLTGLEARYPAALSGGQRQRVAVARALAVEPAVLLLDEAFSALDRNLREAMQLELSLLLRRLHVTTILVTHDQREAFALADRIAVMEAGRIAQVDTPETIYRAPANDHVLHFLGSTNRLRGRAVPAAGGMSVRVDGGLAFPLPGPPPAAAVAVHLRAEEIRLAPAPTRVHGTEPATVALRTFLGAQERIVVILGGEQIVIERPAGDPDPLRATAGAPVYLDFDPARCHVTAVVE